jgi:hypothetical protein
VTTDGLSCCCSLEVLSQGIWMNSRPKDQAMPIASLLLALFSIATSLAIPDLAWGQKVTAAITGKVTDPSGAVIAGAKVMATEVARGTVWITETNPDGFYNLPQVPVGSYEMRVEMTGFQTAVHPPSAWCSTRRPGWTFT